ncbi:MAG: SRPBCC family protein [Anaerolineae bacterium]
MPTYTLEHSTQIHASAETVWQHITEVDIAAFRHPAYFALLGIPKPLRAEIAQPGVGGARTAFFSNGRRFIQQITEWQPYERYAFTFQADPGFRVAYLLDLSGGPFQMKAGTYRLTPKQEGVWLSLSSQYELYGLSGVCLWVPVRLVLALFQRYLLRGIKANAERQEMTLNQPGGATCAQK